MIYYYTTYEDGKLHMLSTGEINENESIIETDIDLFAKKEEVRIIEGEIIFEWQYIWHEPEWNYRIFVTTEQLVTIADIAPEMLVLLNTPPPNPKYKFPSGSLVYFDNVGEQQTALLNMLGIEIQSKP